MRRSSFLSAAALLALAACSSPESVAPSDQSDRPLFSSSKNPKSSDQDDDDQNDNDYIVVLKDNVQDIDGDADDVASRNGGRVLGTYRSALKGFTVRLKSAGDADRVARDPRVAFVEHEQIYTASATQTGATWGLDRVDQRTLPLSTTYSYTGSGSGVTAYIIDTGILTSHTQFGGRAIAGFDAVTTGGTATDCNGHGTHVAGTVGGSTFGVAKNVRLVAVRVLDCNGSGTTSGVIAGIDWVTANATLPAVANMSLGGGASSALDAAVQRAITKGVTFAIAAGNSNLNACNFSPARVAAAITVGATTTTDTRASYSNYGSCVDLFAPGSGITSAWYTSTTATNTISGTSMATPHVAGVAALYLGANPAASPATVVSALRANATSGVVLNRGSNSPNLLLFSNY
ncbi:MAG: S8 family peptidase [Gemmatimonadaceae bacterium]|nr:S8 family peptidase [Gemmatimonadaceae bacterium]